MVVRRGSFGKSSRPRGISRALMCEHDLKLLQSTDSGMLVTGEGGDTRSPSRDPARERDALRAIYVCHTELVCSRIIRICGELLNINNVANAIAEMTRE